jgi:hypothetical protein
MTTTSTTTIATELAQARAIIHGKSFTPRSSQELRNERFRAMAAMIDSPVDTDQPAQTISAPQPAPTTAQRKRISALKRQLDRLEKHHEKLSYKSNKITQ